MLTRALPAICLAPVLMLSGCGKGGDQPVGKPAGAQVLPGTISDAMLNLDQSQSQPLLQPAPQTRATAPAVPSDDASDAAVDVPVKPDAAAPTN
jgi:hypothetical protein